MTPREFDKEVTRLGFSRRSVLGSFRVYSRGTGSSSQHFARDNVKGGAVRFFLAIGEIPSHWPAAQAPIPVSWLEAESPWWDYFDDLDSDDPSDARFLSKVQAQDAAFMWLLSTGLDFLEHSGSRSPQEWCAQERIRIIGADLRRPKGHLPP